MHNPPPADLANRLPLIHVATKSGLWYRSHSLTNSPVFFGRATAYRWDAPAGEYGILYLGSDEYCAFMESIGRGALRTRLVAKSQVEQRGFSKIRFTKWSKALRDHPRKPGGIFYFSRHDPSRTACALYEHCAASVEVVGPAQRWDADAALLANILDHYGFGLG